MTQQTEELHHLSRRKQPLWMGNKQATPKKGFQMETSYAHRGGDPEEKRGSKEWMDS